MIYSITGKKMSTIDQLHKIGQSIWYDNIQRRLLENGELAQMISNGDIRGVTSNPSIFHNAISKSHDYDVALKPLARSGCSPEEIFYQLALEDIRNAADLFKPLYEQSKAADGYVSMEVSPYLARDTQSTISEAKRLWDLVNRPNLMVKIPATEQGIEAIYKSIAAGININVTLIFSLDRYKQVIEAFLSGLEARVAQGLPINSIASVASFFVSRVDTNVDSQLQLLIKSDVSKAAQATQLLGKSAIANARLAYVMFRKMVNTERYSRLQALGAHYQRPLWASTSTKNPAYRDVMYVEELIGPDTVNTVPPQTLDAFKDHGRVEITLSEDATDSTQIIKRLEGLGISMQQVTQQLEDEGVKTFSDAFDALLKTIKERSEAA
ncbi:MAG TPA: transaldolase [Anaerolineaceae bacterium]|nr:transaldolase [Anaerolineaceae bacterium]